MMDFIHELYMNDNFTLYLTIILVILIIAFVLVFFLGKKDEKLEETKRLQKIELDAFKKEEESPSKLEVKEDAIKTNIDPKEGTKEEIKPIETVSEDVTVTEFKPKIDEPEEIELPKEVERPVVAKTIFTDHEEEESPISINDLEKINIDEKDEQLATGLNTLESIKNEFDNISIPEVKENPKEIEKPIFKPSPQIFSSVFVNKNEENMNNNNEEEKITKIENEKPANADAFKTFIIKDDDEDMDLPTLKKDEEEPKTLISEKKEEQSSLLEDVNGETYELK